MSKSNKTPSVVKSNNRIVVDSYLIKKILKHHNEYVQGVSGVKPYDDYEIELAEAERNYLRAVNPTKFPNVDVEAELFEAIEHLDNLDKLKHTCFSSIVFNPDGLRREVYAEIKIIQKAKNASKP